MHIAVFIFSVFAAWRWGDWKNWHKYHTTMLYVAVGNLLYNFIYQDHYLWQLKPPMLFNSHFCGELFYTFIVFPGTALILLTNYPKAPIKQVFRILKFVLIYIILEWIMQMLGTIVYNYGWSIWWSLAWNCLMFPIMVLHHKKPLAAYIASIVFVIVVVIIFPVPLTS